jgi:hypothetical protein
MLLSAEWEAAHLATKYAKKISTFKDLRSDPKMKRRELTMTNIL